MTLEEKLADAEVAYHELLLGRSARVFVDQNGERVEYTAANRDSLLAYINRLQREINTATPKGPLRVIL